MKIMLFATGAALCAAIAFAATETGHNHEKETAAGRPAAVDSHGHAVQPEVTEKGTHDHATEAPDEKIESHAHAGETTAAAVDEHGHAAEADSHGDEVTLSPEAIGQSGIEIEPAKKSLLSGSLTIPGRVSYNAEHIAHVGTPVSGRVAETHARLGDVVKKGDALLTIDSTALGEAQSDLLQKLIQTQVAQTNLELAAALVERTKRLLEVKAVPVAEFDKRTAELKQAEGALKSAKAAAKSVEHTLRLWGLQQADIDHLTSSSEVNPKYIVRAPFDGTVIEREVTLGEVVGPERESLIVIADTSTLWVLAEVPETRIHSVALDSAATVTVTMLDKKQLAGRVTYIAPQIDHLSRTAQVRVLVSQDHTGLKPGMFAEVELSVAGPKEQVLAVPENAIQNFEGGPVVFAAVQGEPNTFASRPVKVERAIAGMVPIRSGLSEGTPIAVTGTFVIKSEMAKGIMEGKTCSGH